MTETTEQTAERRARAIALYRAKHGSISGQSITCLELAHAIADSDKEAGMVLVDKEAWQNFLEKDVKGIIGLMGGVPEGYALVPVDLLEEAYYEGKTDGKDINYRATSFNASEVRAKWIAAAQEEGR